MGISKTGIVNEREKKIKPTDFNLTRKESLLLYGNGEKLAKNF